MVKKLLKRVPKKPVKIKLEVEELEEVPVEINVINIENLTPTFVEPEIQSELVPEVPKVPEISEILINYQLIKKGEKTYRKFKRNDGTTYLEGPIE